MKIMNNISEQPQLTPLNQLGLGLNRAQLNPAASQSAAAADVAGKSESLAPRDERQIAFNPVAMQEAHTLSEERVAKLLGLI